MKFTYFTYFFQAAQEWRFRSLFQRSRRNTVQLPINANDNYLHRTMDSPIQRPKRWLNMNVEPVVFLINFAIGLLVPVTSLFLFYARCVEIVSKEGEPFLLDDPKNASEFCLTMSRSNDSELIDYIDADVSKWRIYQQVRKFRFLKKF